MEKDFDQWNDTKKRVHSDEERKLYHEREIWWCSLGANVGFEQDGTGKGFERPVLILRSMSRNTCYVIPLTTSLKHHKYRVAIGTVEGKQAVVMLSQMRLIDTKRLVNKVCFLDKRYFVTYEKPPKTCFDGFSALFSPLRGQARRHLYPQCI